MKPYTDEEKAYKGERERRFNRGENFIAEFAGEEGLACCWGLIEDNRIFLQSESLLYSSSKVQRNLQLCRNPGFQLICSFPVTQQGH